MTTIDKGNEITIFRPLPGMFRSYQRSTAHRYRGQKVYIYLFDHVEYPKSGGIFCYYRGRLHPEKNMPFPEALAAIDVVKKFTLGTFYFLATKDILFPLAGFAFLPWKRKIALVEKFLDPYCRSADHAMSHIYLHKRFYCKAARAFRQLMYLFLQGLGFSQFICSRGSDVFANFIQHDNAYRYHLGDLFISTTKERLIAHPIKEVDRLFVMYQERENSAPNRAGVYFKLGTIHRFLKWALIIPKVRKAFKRAVQLTKIDDLKLDEADIYYCLTADNYNFLGIDYYVRYNTYLAMHKGVLPPYAEVTPQ